MRNIHTYLLVLVASLMIALGGVAVAQGAPAPVDATDITITPIDPSDLVPDVDVSTTPDTPDEPAPDDGGGDDFAPTPPDDDDGGDDDDNDDDHQIVVTTPRFTG